MFKIEYRGMTGELRGVMASGYCVINTGYDKNGNPKEFLDLRITDGHGRSTAESFWVGTLKVDGVKVSEVDHIYLHKIRGLSGNS